MWTKSLFWKSEWKRIYDTCPEIRPFLEEASRNVWMNALRLWLACPVLGVFVVFGLAFLGLGTIGAFLLTLADKTMDWVYRESDASKRAHEVLSPEEIRRRVKK